MATSDPLEDVLSNLLPKKPQPRPKEAKDGAAKGVPPEEGTGGGTKGALPEEGSQRVGTVTRLARHGAFVRLDGLDRDAFLHVGEIADYYVSSEQIAWHLKPGQRVLVLVEKVEKGRSGRAADIAVSLKPSKVRKLVPDDFDPLTLAVFDLPYELTEEQIEEVFGAYGHVVEVHAFPAISVIDVEGILVEDESRRKFTKVTFFDRAEGMKAMRGLHKKTIPYQIGRETYTQRIGVRIAKRQDFRERLQAEFDEEFREIRENADPDTRRIKRITQRELGDLMPYAVR